MNNPAFNISSRNLHLGLTLLIAINLLPHLQDYTFPAAVIGGICVFWRMAFEYQKIALPRFLFKTVAIFGCLFWTYKTYGTLLGIEAGTAIMIMAASLKLIDRNRYHDVMVVLFLVFMLLLVRILESQSLWITLFGAFDLILVTSLLVQIHSHRALKFSARALIKTGALLFFKTAPFMILLFFVFPRFSSQWSLFASGAQAQSGFSESLDPGSLSQVALSSRSAFRVKFKEKAPLMKDSYWVGSVLAWNQGMKWSRPQLKKDSSKKRVNLDSDLPSTKTSQQKTVYQEILLENRYQQFLFALESPQQIRIVSEKATMGSYWSQQSPKLNPNPWGFIQLLKPTPNRMLYHAQSVARPKKMLSDLGRKMYTQVPEEKDQRVLNLANELKKLQTTPLAAARKALSHYRKNFRYTLDPSPMKTRQVGEFLFDKKVGFCEHFAASFAHLMRLAGIPARVVIGFQGGEQNLISDYTIVHESDAHAWTEIWLEGKNSWHRVDPTSVVAPLRLELGGQAYHNLTEEDQRSPLSSKELLSKIQSSWAYRVFRQTRWTLDSLSTRWNFFLLSYDKKGQQQFFQSLGFKKAKPYFLFLFSVVIFILFFFWIKKQQTQSLKPSLFERQFQQIADLLTQHGLSERAHNEGRQNYLHRAALQFPDLNETLDTYKKTFLRLHYSSAKGTPQQLSFLKSLKGQLKKKLGQKRKRK